MPSDPYAQYLTPPAGDDPYAKYLSPPGAAAAPAQAPKGPPQSMVGDIGKSIDQAVTLGGADWLTSKLPGAPSLQALQGQTQAAHARLPWYVSAPVDVASYIAGPGKLLGPAGAAIGGAGIGGMAAEGALAGGTSAAFQNDTPSLGGVAAGAAGGGALGAAAGGVGAGVGKLLSKPGTINPEAAVAATQGIRTDAYAALTAKPANPVQINRVLGGVMNNLDPSVETGMSPGLKTTIANIRSTVQDLPEANMGQVDSWQRQINAAAQREGHPTDAIVAGQIDSGLNGLIQAGGAGDLQDAAQAAHQNYTMAQNLAEWQRKTAAGGSAGQAPLTEAENWYSGDPDKYATLGGLANQSIGHSFTTSALGHLGANALGAVGGAVGGFPGAFAGEALGYLYARPLIYKGMKGFDARQKLKAFQAAYPAMTGQPLTGAQPGPQVGDAIKNLMLGSAY